MKYFQNKSRFGAHTNFFACYVPVINQKPDDDTFDFLGGHRLPSLQTVALRTCLKYFQNRTRVIG